MSKLFFDTWGWVAIASKNDACHSKVTSFYKSFLMSGGQPVTTDYILAETITLLRSKTSRDDIIVFIDTLLEAEKKKRIIIEIINEKRWHKAWALSKKYKDKPNISFFDFTSFVVMKELNLKEVLTGDKHFEEIGLGFRKSV